jgi:hypothetical protein
MRQMYERREKMYKRSVLMDKRFLSGLHQTKKMALQ